MTETIRQVPRLIAIRSGGYHSCDSAAFRTDDSWQKDNLKEKSMSGMQPNRRLFVVYLLVLALSLAGLAGVSRARTQDIPQNEPNNLVQEPGNSAQEKEQKEEKKDEKKDDKKDEK